MIQFATSATAAASLVICAIPLILYLIFRRRRKDVAWGAVYILRKLLERRKQTSAWKQYVIIALRTLAFAALALFFLKPFLRPQPDAGLPRPPPSTHRVLLLDLSPSMEAAYRGGTALDAALDCCRTALEQATFPGQLDILPLDGSARRYTVADGPIRAAAVNQLIAGLKPTERPADFEQGLERALQVLRASPYERKELYLLSDFSATDLGPPERLAGHWRALRAFGAVPYARALTAPDARNLALHAFTPHVGVLQANQPTLFHLKLGYYGAAPEADAWLRIADDRGHELYSEPVRLALGARTLQIPLALRAGDHLLTASLGDDDYPPDNALTRQFRAQPHLRVTVLQDISLDSGLTNPREWLRLALGADEPAAPIVLGLSDETTAAKPDAAAQAAPRWEVDFANVVQAGPGLFEDRDAVILLNVDRMDADAVEAARRYALRGGTVLLAPGPTADPDLFNATFAALSPARLRPPQPDELDPEVYTGAMIEADTHAILAELETVEHGNLGNARFYRAYEVRRDEVAAGAEVVLALTDGSPLCVFLPIGRGGTLLWTAGLGMDWHSMVVHPAYPVFLNRLFTLAASRRQFSRNLAPEGPLIADVDTARPRLILPDGKHLDLEAFAVGARYRVRYDGPLAPGLYRIRSDPDDAAGEVRVTVRDDRPQSDYRPVAGTDRKTLESHLGAPLFENDASLHAALAAVYPGRPLAAYAGVLMLAWLLLEAGLTRRWFT